MPRSCWISIGKIAVCCPRSNKWQNHDQGSLWCNIGVQGFAQISCIFWQWNPMIFEIWILVTFQVNRWQRQRWFWAMPDFWRTKTIENLRFDRLFGRKSSSTTVGFGAPNVDFWKHDYVLTCMHDLWPNLYLVWYYYEVLTLFSEANLPFFLSYIRWFGGLCVKILDSRIESTSRMPSKSTSAVSRCGWWSKTQGAEGDLPTNEGIGTHKAIWQPLPQVAFVAFGGISARWTGDTVLKILVYEIPESHSIHSDIPTGCFQCCWSRENNENWKSEKCINLYQIIFGTFWQHIDYFPSSKKECGNWNL